MFGLAGLDWPSDEPGLTELVDPTPRAPRRLVNDAFIALRAGTSESWGIVRIAGTGTERSAATRCNEFLDDGEGRVFGDFGDEFDASELAVRAVADHYTGRGPATMLSDMLCERLGQPTAGGDARAARATLPTVARAGAPEPDADGACGDGGGRSGRARCSNGSARRWAKPPAWWRGG